MTTLIPGKIQVAADTSITSATSPITLFTVPGGYTFYISHIVGYMYAFTTGTGAGIGCQLILDQGGSLASCTIMRWYRQYDNFHVDFATPLQAGYNVTLATLGAAGAGVSASIYTTLIGECV